MTVRPRTVDAYGFAVGVLKAIAGLALVTGLILVFIEPAVAAAILTVAALITLWARAVQRQRTVSARSGQPKSFMGIAPGLATLADIEGKLDSGEITESEAQAQLELLKGGGKVDSHLTAMERLMSSGADTADEDESTDVANNDSPDL